MTLETKKQWLPLNIQFFSEEPPADPPADPEDNPTPPTEEEIAKRIEAESDRKLAKALEKKQAEWDQKQQEAIQAALEEKERLSKLSEKERKDEEMTKREKELADRLAEIERKELKADAVADLSEKNLPASFADFLIADTAENTLQNINDFKTAFDDAVNAAVKEKLRQDTPPAGSRATGGVLPTIAELAAENRIIKN